MRVLDPGTMADDDGTWFFLLTMLLTTIFGLIIVSTLISIITKSFVNRVDEFRKGRSAIIEKIIL